MSDFAATRWTLVAQARGNDTKSKTALSELCDAYYKPVVAFLACEDTDAKTHPRTIIKVRPPKNPPFARRIIRGRCVIFPVFDVRLPI